MSCCELSAVEKIHSGDKPQGLVLPLLSKPEVTHLGYPTATSHPYTGAPLPIAGSLWQGRWTASPKWGAVLFPACVLFLLPGNQCL